MAKKTATKKTAAKKSITKKPAAKRTATKAPPRRTGGGKAAPGKKAAVRSKAGPRRRGPAPSRPVSRPKREVTTAVVLSGSSAAAAAVPAGAPDPGRPTALAIAHAGLDKKAEDVTVLDVRGLTSYADYFVVMSADSDRQAAAIADHVEQTMKEQGVTKVGVEGYETGHWILVDYGDVVAHVMGREARGFYDLEGLWADAPKFTVEG